FKVPLVPLLPVIGIIANLYLLGQILSHVLPVILAGSTLLVGFLAYLFLSPISVDDDDDEAPADTPRVAMEKSTGSDKGTFKVLVPLANPENVPELMELAAKIAADRKGEIVALRVITVLDQLSPSAEETRIEREREILELAQGHALKHEIPFTSLVVSGRRISGSILETARTRQCSLILMGWKGFTNTKDKILGEVADAVVKNARTDLMMVKLTGKRLPKNILLPTAGGEHAGQAAMYTAALARDAGSSITVATLLPNEADDLALAKAEELLDAASKGLKDAEVQRVGKQIIRSDSVVNGIIEAGEAYDTIVVGASHQPWFRKFFFGNIPYQIAQNADRNVILVKKYNRVKGFISRALE
ncbi:MAG: universal stress protein, partial [Bacteroidota bacterium]